MYRITHETHKYHFNQRFKHSLDQLIKTLLQKANGIKIQTKILLEKNRVLIHTPLLKVVIGECSHRLSSHW